MSYDETTGIGKTNLSMDSDPESPTYSEIEFDCPRCHKPVMARFYGPCSNCRQELIAKFEPEAQEVEAPKFEPKMNVTPNAVATKE